jgi:hypothetical protein
VRERIQEIELPGDLTELADSLMRFCNGDTAAEILPWAESLSARERDRLRGELALVFSEPEITAEPLDWPEVMDILWEYAELAGWNGTPFEAAPLSPAGTACTVEIRPQDLRTLERASPAVQEVVREVLGRFLPFHLTDGARLGRGDLKKLGNGQ